MTDPGKTEIEGLLAFDNGGAAFPDALAVGPSGDLYRSSEHGYPGMTLLDWFAGQALNAIIASDGMQYVGRPDHDLRHAESAYAAAAAMLKARAKLSEAS